MNKLGTVIVAALALHAVGSHLVIPALREENEKLRHQNEALKDLVNQTYSWGTMMARIIRLHVELGGELRTNEAGQADVEAYMIFSREDML